MCVVFDLEFLTNIKINGEDNDSRSVIITFAWMCESHSGRHGQSLPLQEGPDWPPKPRASNFSGVIVVSIKIG